MEVVRYAAELKSFPFMYNSYSLEEFFKVFYFQDFFHIIIFLKQFSFSPRDLSLRRVSKCSKKLSQKWNFETCFALITYRLKNMLQNPQLIMNSIKSFPSAFVYLYLLIIIPKFQNITAIKRTLSPASIYFIFSLLQSFFFSVSFGDRPAGIHKFFCVFDWVPNWYFFNSFQSSYFGIYKRLGVIWVVENIF